MKIGSTLRLFRLNRGLSQKEMAAGIITESYYSKVERGIHNIDAETLIKILKMHNFNLAEFFETLSIEDKNKSREGILMNEIMIAQNNKDLEQLDKIRDEIYRDKTSSDFIKVWLEKAYVWVKGTNKDVPKKVKEFAKFVLLKRGWQTSSYYYLSQLINLFSADEGYRLMLSAYQAYKNETKIDGLTMQYIALASVNYLNSCWHQNADVKYVRKSIEFLYELPLDPVIGIEKILASYYEALFNQDEEMVSIMLKILKKSNCLNLVKDTIKDGDVHGL